jgi:hypothetical protein
MPSNTRRDIWGAAYCTICACVVALSFVTDENIVPHLQATECIRALGERVAELERRLP